MTQRNTYDTNLWLRHEHTSGSTQWFRQCLRLAHEARNIGALYPTAFSAQHATPEKYRVYELSKVKRGMVAFFDDPNDDNPFGHVVTVQGRHTDGSLYAWSNDVEGAGKVSLVPLSFFPNNWGDSFQFAATWLNGVVLDMPKVAAKAVARPNLDDAIASLDKVIQSNSSDHRLVKAIKRDRARLVAHKKHFS
jgi:hypothetical protein